MTYIQAVAWLQKNFCHKYDDYATECAGCPNSKVCYMDLSHIESDTERANIFENNIISAVEFFKEN